MLRASGDFGFGEFSLSLSLCFWSENTSRVVLEYLKKKKKSANGVCELAVLAKESRTGGHQRRFWLLSGDSLSWRYCLGHSLKGVRSNTVPIIGKTCLGVEKLVIDHLFNSLCLQLQLSFS